MSALKVVGYARYSTDKQTDNSIAYQQEAILNYCQKEGLVLNCFYTDAAVSGTNLKREGLQSLLAAAKRHEFDTVIVYDISRGSRDVGDWFTLRNLLAELGITLIAVKQDLGDITNPSDFIREALEVSIAQYEVLQTRQKSIAGTAEQAKLGKFLGGVPPLGYDVIDQEYVINPEEAGWVVTIFNMYAAGASYGDILAALPPNARGKKGQPLRKNSLYYILRNPRYAGTYIWNERIVKRFGNWAGGRPNPAAVHIEGGIPAIIDKDTMERVRRRMEANRNAPGRNTAKREYLLSGLIVCEHCGASYIGRTSKNQRGYVSTSYVCGNKYRTQGCCAPNINAAKLEKIVLDLVREYLAESDLRSKAKDIAHQVNHFTPEFRREKKELAEIERKLANGMKAVLDGMYFPELEDEMGRLRVRKEEIEAVMARASSGLGKVTAEKIVKIFEKGREALEGNDARFAIECNVTKIIAHLNGNVSVNVGVSLSGCGGPQVVKPTTFTIQVA